jgi:hypothetical protein
MTVDGRLLTFRPLDGCEGAFDILAVVTDLVDLWLADGLMLDLVPATLLGRLPDNDAG